MIESEWGCLYLQAAHCVYPKMSAWEEIMENELRVPNHIAIILDGNGRWAKKRGMPRGYGHIVGCDNLEKMCDVIKDMGVKYLTVYAFSTENWKRSREEVEGLMKLFRQ